MNIHEFGITSEGKTVRKPHYKRNLKESWASSSKGNNKSRPSGLRKTRPDNNSLAHRTTWLRSDLAELDKNLVLNFSEIAFIWTSQCEANFKSDRSHVVMCAKELGLVIVFLRPLGLDLL